MSKIILFLAGVFLFAGLYPNARTVSSKKELLLSDFDEKIKGYSLYQPYPEDSKQFYKIKIVSGKQGKCLRLKYNVDSPKKAVGGVVFDLDNINFSDYRTLKIDVRRKKDTTGVIELQLIGKNKEKGTRILAGITGKWQTIKVPFNRFEGLKKDAVLEKLILSVDKSKVDKKEGVLFFDNIIFSTAPVKPTDVMEGKKRAEVLSKRLNNLVLKRKEEFIPPENDNEFLLAVASDTWKFMHHTVDSENHLPIDTVGIKPLFIGDYVSTTNLGLYIMSVISAYDFNFITKEQAVEKIDNMLDTVEDMAVFNGFMFNYYDTTTLDITSNFISFVDSGWFCIGLTVAEQAFPKELGKKCRNILKEKDFSFFYDTDECQMRHGYDLKKGGFSEYHYGTFYTEARAGSALAVGRKDVPATHWFRMYRVFPREWDWQRQVPKGIKYEKFAGVDVMEGYYEYKNIKYVPSWGGSMFEALMPALVIDEINHAPRSLGENAKRHVRLQKGFSRQKKYPVWGFSPSCTPGKGYKEYGVPEAGMEGYGGGVAAPYASFLALNIGDKSAVENLRKFLKINKDMYGPYGFYDSMSLGKEKKAAGKYLILDQAMILISINNYLNNGAIQKRFERTKEFDYFKEYLSMEEFNIF